MQHRSFAAFAALSLLLPLAGVARAAEPAPLAAAVRAEDPKPTERDVSHFNLGKSGLALEGHDPVAYFPEGGGKPLKGDAKFSATHKGVTYHFATEANRQLFLKDPAKFEPQYGGWCAYAIPGKEKVEVDPESFVVREGKLYLFYKGFFNDTRAKWQKEPADFVKRGDVAWKEITAKPLPEKKK
jgi:YHS domain-containing protein